MHFGVFDHLDASGLPLADLYDNRLKLIEQYERAGIRSYHLAEHHSTPLGMAPSPSVFLAAIAQRTRTLLFGPMVYTLSLYHPVRLAEEICMLDHLSRGRLQIGFGRGISPIELEMYNIDPASGPARYIETYDILMKALAGKPFSHEGRFYRFDEVPMPVATYQKPRPPMWYGAALPAAAVWAAQNGINIVSLRPPAEMRVVTDSFRKAWAAAGNDPAMVPFHGMARHVVVAETDADALAAARRAYAHWHANFWYLWVHHNRLGVAPPYNAYPESFDVLLERRQALCGSPATVAAQLADQAGEGQVNYALLDFAFGSMSLEESLRSLELFSKQVMPKFRTA